MAQCHTLHVLSLKAQLRGSINEAIEIRWKLEINTSWYISSIKQAKENQTLWPMSTITDLPQV